MKHRPRISNGSTLARDPQGYPATVLSDGGPAGFISTLRMDSKRETKS